MTIKYFLRSKGSAVPVFIRVSISREKLYRKKTRYVANSEKWHKDKTLQLKLRKLQNEIEESYNNTLNHNEHWIDNLLYATNQSETVQNQIKRMLETAHIRKNHKGGVGLSEGRKKILNTFLGVINRYHKDLPLRVVDKKEAEKFQGWLFKQGYSVNYVGKNIELLKTACRDAEKEGKLINPEIKQVVKLKQKKQELVIITPKEQSTIKGLQLPPHLDNARKWLLLGCLVGQRGSDLLGLRATDIKTNGKAKYFEILQRKTGKKVNVPLVPEAVKMLNDFPRPISIQKLNNYMKDICKLAEMNDLIYGYRRGSAGVPSEYKYFKKWELVGTHDLRRSFATNFYGKIPTPILMGITGHSSENTFLKYIGKTSLDNAIQFLEYFEKLS